MGIVSRIGLWIDKHFPERMSVDEVNSKIESFSRLAERIARLEAQAGGLVNVVDSADEFRVAVTKELTDIKAEMIKVKAFLQLKQVSQSKMPDLTGAGPWKR